MRRDTRCDNRAVGQKIEVPAGVSARHGLPAADEQVPFVGDRPAPQGRVVKGDDGRVAAVAQDDPAGLGGRQPPAGGPVALDEDEHAAREQQLEPRREGLFKLGLAKLGAGSAGAAASERTNRHLASAFLAFARAALIMAGEKSSPVTAYPSAASSTVRVPVPHPMSATAAGAAGR